MSDYLTEEEQIALLKNWIKQYSFVIIAGILLAIALVAGTRYWQQRQAKIMSHASAVYDEMIALRSQNDAKGTTVQAKKLIAHYPSTTYSTMAALMLARDAAELKQYPEAAKQLTWVIDQSKVSSFKDIAKIRLARVQIALNQPAESLKVLQRIDNKQFKGLADEVSGDAYLALKDPQSARRHYQKALTELPNAEIIRPLLQMKYDSLATITSLTA
ncbi:MAG: tetratricopeptide repeat protein [Gammaproteobacteria bacterium]|nr:tetratricopeptide repeat protein [Gammaproteobacteria bacterium]